MTVFAGFALHGLRQAYRANRGGRAGAASQTKGSHMNTITARLFMAYATFVHRIETREERGASMTEYAILVAVMAGIVLALVTLLGGKLSTFINSINITT
jgi:Flp pilus assembly pilin Flp